MTMKFRLIIILLALVPAAACLSPKVTAEEGKRTYYLGLILTSAPSNDTRFTSYFTGALDIISDREDFIVELKTFEDREDFVKALDSRELDFAASLKRDLLMEMVEKHGYTPFVTAKLYKRDKSRYCVYVKSGDAAAEAKDLIGKTVSFDGGLDTWLDLAEIAGGNPARFFKLKAAPNPSAAIYDLHLDSAEACLANDLHMDFVRMTNPAPVKDFAEAACAKRVKNAPFCYSERIPASFAERIASMLVAAYDDEDFKRYRPLMKTAGIRFVSVSMEDYAEEFQRLKDAEEKGYTAAYRDWISSISR